MNPVFQKSNSQQDLKHPSTTGSTFLKITNQSNKCISILEKVLLFGSVLVGITGLVIGSVCNLNNPVGLSFFVVGLISIIISIVCFALAACKYFTKREDPSKKLITPGVAPEVPPGVPEVPLMTHLDEIKYIKDNLQSILSLKVLEDSCIEEVRVEYSFYNSCYLQFSFLGSSDIYKLNVEPGFDRLYPHDQRSTYSSPIDMIYQLGAKAKQIVKDLKLNKLMISDMIFERLQCNQQSYDLLKEERLDGYVNLSEETSHLLSQEVIDQLCIFIYETGITIDWCNILINPESPDIIVLSGLRVADKTNMNDVEDNSLFGNFLGRGLINCLSSKEHIDQVMNYFSKYFIKSTQKVLEHQKMIANRLSQLTCRAKFSDLIHSDVDTDKREEELSYENLESFKECIRSNIDQCLDDNNQFVIPENLENCIQECLLSIIQGKAIDQKNQQQVVEYLDDCLSDDVCLFKLANYPEFSFKVYKGDRALANQLAYTSYNHSVLIGNIIQEKKLLLKQPPRKLLSINIKGQIYQVIVSKEIAEVERGYYSNINEIRSSPHNTYCAIRDLVKLLMIHTIDVNRSNILLLPPPNHVTYRSNNRLLLTDIEISDSIENSFWNILDFVTSEELLYKILVYSLEIGIIQRICGNDIERTQSYIESCILKVTNNIGMYKRVLYYLHNSFTARYLPSYNESYINIKTLMSKGFDKTLNMNLLPRDGDLCLEYFTMKGIKEIVMKDALKEVLEELDKLLKQKRVLYSIGNIFLQRTITSEDIKNSLVLSAYNQVYNNDNVGLSWLQQIIDALISHGYACRNSDNSFCV